MPRPSTQSSTLSAPSSAVATDGQLTTWSSLEPSSHDARAAPPSTSPTTRSARRYHENDMT
jgi:hypothetical protein